MNHARETAYVLLALRRELLERTIADLAGNAQKVTQHDARMDALASMLPMPLRGVRAQHQRIGNPVRRMIERRGILHYAEEFSA